MQIYYNHLYQKRIFATTKRCNVMTINKSKCNNSWRWKVHTTCLASNIWLVCLFDICRKLCPWYSWLLANLLLTLRREALKDTSCQCVLVFGATTKLLYAWKFERGVKNIRKITWVNIVVSIPKKDNGVETIMFY